MAGLLVLLVLLVLLAQRAKRARRSTPRGSAPPRAVAEALVEEPPVAGPLSALAPVRLEVIRDTALATQWDDLMARWHPLGFQGAFGYRLRYFITAGELRLGCALLSGAARAVAVRDDWIGWTAQARRQNLPRVLNNSRFLIFPHVRVPHLASQVLGQLARRARSDWLEHWGFAPLLLESFVDPRQRAGTCYRAAGWQLLPPAPRDLTASAAKNGASGKRARFARVKRQVWSRAATIETFPIFR